MSIKLPKPPNAELLITTDQKGRVTVNQGVLREIRVFFEELFKVISMPIGRIAWSSIGFVGSKLTDIETRQHSNLQAIAELNTGSTSIEKDKHLSNAQGKAWQDHMPKTTDVHGVTSPSVVVGSETAQTLKNKTLDATNKYGGATHNTTFEADGTMVMNGDATVWKDIKFPMAPPKTTGAGNPTLTTYNGNMRGYSFAVNDVHDFNPEEIDHDAKIGSTATFHVHWLSRSNDVNDRGVKWQLEYAIEPTSGALPAPTTVSAEATVPLGTAVNTPYSTNMATFVIPGIAKLAYLRITRIASAGTAPTTDPILSATHFHYELDTVGSRQITTK